MIEGDCVFIKKNSDAFILTESLNKWRIIIILFSRYGKIPRSQLVSEADTNSVDGLTTF